TGDVRVKVAVGNCAGSMMRPLNWLSRRSLSLVTEVRSTVMSAFVTFVPLMVTDPVTLLVRPTAVLSCPNKTSLTRYPACEPEPTFHVPASGADASFVLSDAAGEAELLGDVPGVTCSLGGGSLSMKWM